MRSKAEEFADKVDKAAAEDGMSALSRLISDRTRPHHVLTLPGELGADGATVALVALRSTEMREARLAAMKYLREVEKLDDWTIATEFGQNLLDEEIQVQLLHRAMRDPENLHRLFTKSATDLRMNLEPDEIAALFTAFVVWQDSRSPLQHVHTPDELEALVTALGKDSTGKTSLSFYDTATLRRIVIGLAALYRKRMRELYLATLSQSDTSGSSNPESE